MKMIVFVGIIKVLILGSHSNLVIESLPLQLKLSELAFFISEFILNLWAHSFLFL